MRCAPRRNALQELGAKDAALFLVDLKVDSRPAQLERAPRGARRARGVLPLRPAEEQKKPGAVARARHAAARRQRAARAGARGGAGDRRRRRPRAHARQPAAATSARRPTSPSEAKKLAREFKLEVEVLERERHGEARHGRVPRRHAARRTSRRSSSCCATTARGEEARKPRRRWSARASPSTPAASRSSRPARWTR